MNPAYERYLAAERSINEGLIRPEIPEWDRQDPEQRIRRHHRRMEEMSAFLSSCGEPQQGVATIHVGGTSGKGSVVCMLAEILSAAGHSVGRHVSPYVQASTEKLWIDGLYAEADFFADLVDWVMPLALPWRVPETVASPHGMASVALTMEALRRTGVPISVMEVGCGGRYDLTSFVDTCVTVVTNVGHDHMVALGPTLRDVAHHKAGIIRPGVPVVTAARGEALEVIAAEAAELDAPLTVVPRDPEGDFRSENRALVLAAIDALARQLPLGRDAIETGLARARMPGRLERMPGEIPVFLDGAHNQEKVAAMLKGLAARWSGPYRSASHSSNSCRSGRHFCDKPPCTTRLRWGWPR